MNPLAYIMRGLIKGYQWLISPILPGSCRFYPSCSSYTLQAIETHGALKGGWLGLKRIVRCHPWNDGGMDPVPGTDDPDANDSNDIDHHHTHSTSCASTDHKL